MAEINLMILGIFSIIYDALLSVAGAVVEPAFNAIMSVTLKLLDAVALPTIVKLIQIIRKSPSTASIVVIIIELFITVVDLILEHTPGRRVIVEGIVNGVFGMYQWIIGSSSLDCLRWSPVNYILHGSEPIEDSLSNPYYLSLKLMNEGIKPTAMVVLALIVMVELFQITVRTEGMRNSGFESPFKLMLKVAVCKILLDNTALILRAIFEMGTGLVLRLQIIVSGVNLKPGKEVMDHFFKQLWTMRIHELALMYCESFIQYGLVWLFFQIALPFIIMARVIEIYIMIVLAPIPFATFAHQEFSSIGKSYLKQFVGVSFKTAVMFIIILIYGSLMTIATFDVGNETLISAALQVMELLFSLGLWIPGAIAFAVFFLLKPLIFSLMLLFALGGADSYTRKITGAWY